jgi:2-deoxy-D-gluconate 3-dehydrogenase
MQIPSFSLNGKVALITGSGSGIGRTIAIGLAQAGADLVITELPDKKDKAQETARAVMELGRKALAVELDVTDLISIRNMAEASMDMFGRVDILVNNAGVIIRKKAIDVTEQDWDRVLDVNLKGVFFTCQAIGKVMINQGSGKIINMASINGVVGSVERAAYTASKAGLINMTRTLAAEWAEFGIHVNAIGPTYMTTPLTESLFEQEEFREQLFSRQLIQRAGRPEDLVGAVLFLASSASDLVTGHTIMVDGGWTAV